MANVLLTRTSDAQSKPVIDGQLIFDTSGNGKMYLDNGTERLEMGGAMDVDQVLDKTSTNPISNKAVAGVMLTNMDDISALTQNGFLADALVVKQLNNNLIGVSNYLLDIKQKGARMRALDYNNPTELTDDDLATGFTCPSDGVFIVTELYTINGNYKPNLKINNSVVYRTIGNNTPIQSIHYYVSKDDIITVDVTNYVTGKAIFVPYKD